MANPDPEAERARRVSSRPDESRPRASLVNVFRDNLTSFRYLLVVAGIGAFLVGVLIFIFVRELDSTGLATMGIGSSGSGSSESQASGQSSRFGADMGTA